uniref:Uncharacterized protein n=1 Tax=Rhizophora mucronata TaxID=61149 RepID=A0A2P2MVW4_RHIMU
MNEYNLSDCAPGNRVFNLLSAISKGLDQLRGKNFALLIHDML